MTLSKDTIKAIMSIAQNLQKQYDILGVPGTQNVRNPYPLHKLIIGVLPTRKKNGFSIGQIKDRLDEWGYRVPKQTLQSVISKMAGNGIIHKERIKMFEGTIKGKRSIKTCYSFVP